MKKKIGFLFDLDGVLIDSERRYTRIWQAIERDFPTGVPDFARVIKGMALHNIIDRYFPAPQVGKAVEMRCIEAEKTLVFDYMPGALSLLQALREREVPVALVTSSDKVKMRMLDKCLPGIFNMFDALVDGDMVTHGKPDPEPYLMGMRLLGVNPERCVVIEDSLTGIESGHRSGAYVIGMTDTLGREAVEPVADEVYDSLAEIDVEAVLQLLENR